MRKFDTIIQVPSKTPPTAPDQLQFGALILASSAEVTFPEAAANTSAIESEIAKAKDVAERQPKEARRLSRLAQWFPKHAAEIVEWLVANGKTNIAAKIQFSPLIVSRPGAAKNTTKKSAGRPLDDELSYELARFEAFMKAGKYKSTRDAAIAFCGVRQAQPLQNKLSTFGRAFELSRRPRIVRGPEHSRRPTMSRDPNDDRSDSMNPNNDAYWDSLDNHADQLNPAPHPQVPRVLLLLPIIPMLKHA